MAIDAFSTLTRLIKIIHVTQQHLVLTQQVSINNQQYVQLKHR